MFSTDSLCELNFVLEFNLSKEISDNQEHIKLSVHHVDVPVVEIPACTIGHKSTPVKTPGQVFCIEFNDRIKDKLYLLEKWSHALYDKPFGWANDDLYIDAKLYGYKDDELVTSFMLYNLYPTFLFPATKFENQVELKFSFEDAKAMQANINYNDLQNIDKATMYDISKYIKEYKDRENKCKYCAYYNVQGGRCYTCKNHDWFVQEVNLKQYIIKRVTEDSAKEFTNSKEGIALKSKVDLRKNVYDDFNKYVEKQKEILDNELQDRYADWSNLNIDYNYKLAKYSSDNIDKALASLDSISNSVNGSK